jgi:poly-gamma-glutamate synthesis protein (capsule biosynthesis protein)
VIVYLSNHEWGEDNAATKDWARQLAHRCVEAGATVYVSHGAPMLHGMEIHRGRPIFHGLGSLVFHSRTAPGHYPPEVWESVIAHARFEQGLLRDLEIVPVALNETGDDSQRPLATRGRPRLAESEQAQRILERFQRLSEALGTRLEIRDDRGWIKQ